MIFTAKTNEWGVLKQQERKWFARLVIEALFWIHCADESAWIDKYTPIKDVEASEDMQSFKMTGVENFDNLSLSDRDLVLWHCLKCACYPNVKVNSAVLEAGLVAIIRILYWKLKEEIDLTVDEWNFDQWSDIEERSLYTTYRIFCENIYRHLHLSDFSQQLSDTNRLAPKVKVKLLNKIGVPVYLNEVHADVPAGIIEAAIADMFSDYEISHKEKFKEITYYRKLHHKLYPISILNPETIFFVVDEPYWREKLYTLERIFTPADSDHTFTHKEARNRGFKPAYYNTNQTLNRINKNRGYAYWDLLFACLREQPIPNFSKLRKTKYRESWFETIEQTVSPDDLLWLEQNIITSEYVIRLPKQCANQ